MAKLPPLELLVVDGLTNVALEGARIRWAAADELWIVDLRDPGIGRAAVAHSLDSIGAELTTDGSGRASLARTGAQAAVLALVEHSGRSRLVRTGDRAAPTSGEPPGPQTVRLFRERSLRIELVDAAGELQLGVPVGIRMGPTGSAAARWLWKGWTESAEGGVVLERVDELLDSFYDALDEGPGAHGTGLLSVDVYPRSQPSAAVDFSPYLWDLPVVRLVLPAQGTLRVRVLRGDGADSSQAGWVRLTADAQWSDPREWVPPAWSTRKLERGQARFSNVPLGGKFSLEVRLDESKRTLRRTLEGPTQQTPEVELVVVEPEAGPRITARILDASGAALERTWVSVDQRMLSSPAEAHRSGAEPAPSAGLPLRERPYRSTLRTDSFGSLTLLLEGALETDAECSLTFECRVGDPGELQRATLTLRNTQGLPSLALGNVRLERR